MEENRRIASAFARDTIEAGGEEAYRELLAASADDTGVIRFNMALCEWYADHGLTYGPTELRYACGGDYHDYLVKSPYATFYMPENWENGFKSSLTQDPDFLHEDYATVKYCFESNVYQMWNYQAYMGFNEYDNDIHIEFLYNQPASIMATSRHIQVHSVEIGIRKLFKESHSLLLTIP